MSDLEAERIIHQEGSPERSLWAAVLVGVYRDLTNFRDGEFRPGSSSWEHEKALRYLDSPDFLTVCEFAGLEPSYVKKKFKESVGEIRMNRKRMIERTRRRSSDV